MIRGTDELARTVVEAAADPADMRPPRPKSLLFIAALLFLSRTLCQECKDIKTAEWIVSFAAMK